MDRKPRYAPACITFKGQLLPVSQYVAHPPHKHPPDCPLTPDCTALELRTLHVSRWFGFEKAWINAELKVVVSGFPASDEIRRTWQVCREHKTSKHGEIIDSMARSLWIDAWASYREERGLSTGRPGGEISEAAPSMPRLALLAATEIAVEYCLHNGLDHTDPSASLETLYQRAIDAGADTDSKRGTREDFGYCMYMTWCGSGVNWTDYNPSFDIEYPRGETPSVYYCDKAHKCKLDYVSRSKYMPNWIANYLDHGNYYAKSLAIGEVTL